MVHFIDVEREKLKTLHLKNKLILKMVSEMTEFYFAMKAIDILVKRNPDYKLDPNASCQIDGLLETERAAHNAYWALREIYISEFDDIEITDEVIEIAAKSYAEEALIARGWEKEIKDGNLVYHE